MTFLVSDGVLPSNEGRGYVLRRLIRRAARHGKLLGIEGIFLNSIVEKVIESWKIEYPEIKEREEQIKKVIKAEEEKFEETIHQGINILENYIEDMMKNHKKCLSGEEAFKLYDTYGFPLDLTKEILEEKGLKVDEDEFNIHMEEQRNRARKAREGLSDSGWKNGYTLETLKGYQTIFKGYETTNLESEVIGLFIDGENVNKLTEGQEGLLILKETPFYAESGGQIGDIGFIENKSFKGKVIDTKHTTDETIIHFIEVQMGSVNVGDTVWANVDKNIEVILRGIIQLPTCFIEH